MSDTETKPRIRKSEYSGCTLHPNVEENPRRAGSHGHNSLQIILDDPGITYEDFRARGGRTNDLRWDINAGRVVVKS